MQRCIDVNRTQDAVVLAPLPPPPSFILLFLSVHEGGALAALGVVGGCSNERTACVHATIPSVLDSFSICF